MIEILKQASIISMSRNPVTYCFKALTSTGSDFGSKGMTASLVVGEGLKEGDSIVVRFTEPNNAPVSIDFQVNSIISDNPEIIPPKPSDSVLQVPLLSYISDIAARISKHPRLSPFFTFSAKEVSPNLVSLDAMAKSIDIGWSIDFTQSVLNDFAIAPTFESTPSVIDPRPAHHKILYEIYFENTYLSGDFKRIASLEAAADEKGLVVFDIQDVLDSAFKNALSAQCIPAFLANTPHKADNIRRYYLRIAERYGSTSISYDWIYIGDVKKPNIIQLGGIAQNLWQDNPEFTSSTALTDTLLSWYPRTKIIGINQPEWLAWRALSDNDKVCLKVNIIDEEGLLSSLDIFHNTPPITLKKGETILLPVGASQLNLPNIDTAVRYQVIVQSYNNLGTFKSETYTYYIDKQYYETQRFIMYLNSFGVPQTLRCTGMFSPAMNIERNTSKKPLSPFADVATTGDVPMRSMSDFVFTYRSGYLRNDEIHALQELLTAEYVFEVFEEGFIPLKITDKQFKLPETGQFMSVIEFTAAPRVDYRNYANAHRFSLTNPISTNWKADDFDQQNRLAFGLKWR